MRLEGVGHLLGQLGVALLEAHRVVLGSQHTQLHVRVGLGRHLVAGDGQVACHGVHHAGLKLHERVVVVADGLQLLERVGQRLLTLLVLQHVQRRRIDLRQHRLAGQILKLLRVAVLLHDHHLLVVHVRLRERVVVLAVLHGEAVPDAVDGAAADERVLRVPVDGLQLELPAHLLAHGFGKLQVEAGELAIVAHVAVRRIPLVETHRQRERAVRGRAVGALRISAAGATGQHHRRQRQRGDSRRERYEFLLHRISHHPQVRPMRSLPWWRLRFGRFSTLLY